MKRLILVLAGGTVLCASAMAFDANADFGRFMHSMLPKVKRAFETKSTKFFEDVSTPDFSETEGGKTATKAESMASMKQMFDMAKTIKVDFKVVSAKAKGDTGVAVTSGHYVAMLKPTPKDKKSHRMVMDMKMKETWVRSGKGWKIKSIENTGPMKSTMDGKPFDPSKMGG